jgi:hypothetical protein
MKCDETYLFEIHRRCTTRWRGTPWTHPLLSWLSRSRGGQVVRSRRLSTAREGTTHRTRCAAMSSLCRHLTWITTDSHCYHHTRPLDLAVLHNLSLHQRIRVKCCALTAPPLRHDSRHRDATRACAIDAASQASAVTTSPHPLLDTRSVETEEGYEWNEPRVCGGARFCSWPNHWGLSIKIQWMKMILAGWALGCGPPAQPGARRT